jgi:hypothetical protein
MTKRVGSVLSAEELLEKEECSSFKVKFDTLQKYINSEPFLDYQKTKNELTEMRFVASNSGHDSIEAYVPILDKIQAFRDRAVAIYVQANEEHLILKEHYDNLYKIWVGKYSEANSLDRREGEAADILYQFLDCRSKREVLFEAAKQVVYNLSQQHNTIISKIKTLAQSYVVHGAKNADAAFLEAKSSLIKKRDYQDRSRISIPESAEEGASPQKLRTVDWDEIRD